MSLQFFEDFQPGESRTFGNYTLGEDEITDFAHDYDPQPFHIDNEAARNSIFGGLIASGWHTAAVMMQLFVENILQDCATVGSPGFDELRWHKPVRPGDTLHVEATCMDTRPSASRPEIGAVDYALKVHNQHDELVASVVYIVLLRRREQGHAQG